MSSDGNGRAGFRVLVVDDDQDTADSAADILKYLGYQGMAAYDAANAYKLAGLLTPQVVILDLAMPDGDFADLRQWLRHGGRQATGPQGRLCAPFHQARGLAGVDPGPGRIPNKRRTSSNPLRWLQIIEKWRKEPGVAVPLQGYCARKFP